MRRSVRGDGEGERDGDVLVMISHQRDCGQVQTKVNSGKTGKGKRKQIRD